MPNYVVDVIHKDFEVETINFGEVDQLDMLRSLAARPNRAEEIFVIGRSGNGQPEKSETWTAAHVEEYLALIAGMAKNFSPFTTFAQFSPEADDRDDETK